MRRQVDVLGDSADQPLLPEEAMIVGTLLTGKTSLRHTFGVARQALGNPIIFANRSLKVIEHTDDDPDDEVWRKTVEGGHVPLLDEGFSKEHNRIINGDSPVIIDMSNQQNRMMTAQVTHGGDSYGFATVFECYREFSSEDERILATLAKTAGRVFYEKLLNGTYKREPHEQLLVDAIGGYDLGDEGFAKLRELFGIRAAKSLRLLLIKPTGAVDHPALPLVKYDIENKVGFSPNVVVGDAVLCILDAERLQRAGQSTMEKLKRYCAGQKLHACFSRIFRDFRDTKSHYEMISAALDLRERLDATSSAVFRYDDYMPYHLLETASRTCALETFIVPEAASLFAYDEENNGEMADTLAKFYENACDVTKTAKAMHLHYNTVDYRLRRIADICGIDVRNAGNSIGLRVSLLVNRYQQSLKR